MIINIASVRRLVGMVLVSASLASLAACSAAPGEEMSVEDGSSEVTSTSAHFETFVGKDGQHYFSLVAGNGQNVLRSEGYVSVAGMNGGIASVTANGVDLANYDILQAKDGEFYFNITSAANGQTVATSEMYSTKANAQRASRTVRGLVLLTGDPRGHACRQARALRDLHGRGQEGVLPPPRRQRRDCPAVAGLHHQAERRDRHCFGEGQRRPGVAVVDRRDRRR